MDKNSKNINAILILAAGYKAYDDTFRLSEPFLNIGNTLIVERIKKFSSEFSKIYIAVDSFRYIFRNLKAFENCIFIDVGKTKGVTDTIRIAIENIEEEFINIIPITTIPDKNFQNKKTIYFGKEKISKENWSGIDYKKDILKYFFKKDKLNFQQKCFPFTGRISSNKKDILKAIKELKKNEIRDLLFLARLLINKYSHEIIHEKWFDAGHSTTYFETKVSSFTSRFFNQISFSSKRNTIIKTSQEKEKLFKEKEFYNKIPIHQKIYYPILIDEKNNDTLELEYLPFPNLAEVFLFREINANRWENIVLSLFKIYSAFYIDTTKYISNASLIYSKKLNSRMDSLHKLASQGKNNLLKELLHKGKEINNLFLPSLNETVEELNSYLEKYEQELPLFFGHGDLCFNNILIEPISGCIKLIDPKAERLFNNKVGYMDPNYDLAKLNHSFSCLYDSIVNNLFTLIYEKKRYFLKIIKPKNYEAANFYFKKIFTDKLIKEDLLRILTSNLFISMVPLHQDNEDKMCALLIIGISLFYNVDLETYMINL